MATTVAEDNLNQPGSGRRLGTLMSTSNGGMTATLPKGQIHIFPGGNKPFSTGSTQFIGQARDRRPAGPRCFSLNPCRPVFGSSRFTGPRRGAPFVIDPAWGLDR